MFFCFSFSSFFPLFFPSILLLFPFPSFFLVFLVPKFLPVLSPSLQFFLSSFILLYFVCVCVFFLSGFVFLSSYISCYFTLFFLFFFYLSVCLSYFLFVWVFFSLLSFLSFLFVLFLVRLSLFSSSVSCFYYCLFPCIVRPFPYSFYYLLFSLSLLLHRQTTLQFPFLFVCINISQTACGYKHSSLFS